jgi:hypothetical protein
MPPDAETIVRRAYHAAEGNVMDVQGFIDLFAHDGVIHAGQKTFRGEELPYVVVFMGKLAGVIEGNRARRGVPAQTSGTWKMARSRSSIATSTSCSNK